MNKSPYLPHTEEEIKEMLDKIGISSINELFSPIKDELKNKSPLKLPPPLSEPELLRELSEVAGKNITEGITFLGAGSYKHFIPSVVPYLAQRSEFVTPYTPYQPELSQGTLQAIFEFQTVVAELFGLDVANASMYDGATALAEAALMSMRLKNTKKVAVSLSVHPEYLRVLKTYLNALDGEIIEIPYNEKGLTDFSSAEMLNGKDISSIIIQNPNFFGCIEPVEKFSTLAHKINALSVVVVTEPFSLGLLKPPGASGADIAVGEGQSLGIPLSFGGPYLGLFATKNEFLRQMPGRLVGETVDRHGKRGYVLTFATREQHIRRERATSNICTNESLCALTSLIYLSTIGRTGFRTLSEQNLSKAEYAKSKLRKVSGVKLKFEAPTFNEFVIELKVNAEKVAKKLSKKGIVSGLPLGRYYPEHKNSMLVTVTEMNSKKEIDTLVSELKKI